MKNIIILCGLIISQIGCLNLDDLLLFDKESENIIYQPAPRKLAKPQVQVPAVKEDNESCYAITILNNNNPTDDKESDYIVCKASRDQFLEVMARIYDNESSSQTKE